MKHPTLSVIIPVYNESKTVRQLLDQVWTARLEEGPTLLTKELIIIESNSSDDSRRIVQDFAQAINASSPGSVTVILQDRPRGKGNAVRAGLDAASGEIILIQDGDLEYSVTDYPALLAPLLRNRTDFVLGSRHMSADGWKIRKFGKNQLRSKFMNMGGLLFHTFFNLIYGTSLTDPTTMYKVFKRSALDNFDLVSNRFDFDFEIIAKLIRTGHKPLEIPISYTSRGFEEGKKIRIFRDPLTWVVAILRFRLCSLRSTRKAECEAPVAN